MTTLSDYVSKLRGEGYRAFTVSKAAQDLGIEPRAVLLKCMRLKRKGELLSPVKGLYVPIPAEHQKIGSIPADELIPIVMDHLKIDYYVCLLSSALYHGASHQKPQVFQIMTNHRGIRIKAGKLKILLIYKKSIKESLVQKIPTKTGYLSVSTPEQTLVDLFLFPKHCGGLNSIATVLSELIDVIDSDKLIEIAKKTHQKIWIQRLGFVLERINPVDQENQRLLVNKLEKYLTDKKLSYIPLAPELGIKGFKRDNKWKIIINTDIEADE